MKLEYMERFLQICKEPTADRESTFRETFGVTDEQQIAFLKKVGLFAWESPLDVLETNTRLLKELRVEELIHSTVADLKQKYPVSKSLEVEVFLMDEHNSYCREKLGGVSAFANEGRICFIIYPEHNVRDILLSTVLHEYHHHWRNSVLQQGDAEPLSLLESIVDEGLAEHFVAHEIGKEHCGPWVHALTEAEARELWPLYRDQQDLRAGKAPYLFGNKEKGIPLWAGYAMGYYLVQWYRERHPEATMEELTLLPGDAYLPAE